MRDAIDECRSIIRQHSRSFSLAARLLPQPSRDWAVVAYAWCRRADNAVDDSPDDDLEAAVVQLEDELDAIYDGQTLGNPVLDAFQHVVELRNIPRLYPTELIRGMEMDARDTRYDTLDDLLVYCHRVAGVVGLMMCHVLGVRDDEALVHAAHLGIAMQLTNICRDVEEDWRRGRCYLPREWLTTRCLDELDGPADGPLSPEVRCELAGPIRRLLELAEDYYRSGDDGIPSLDSRSALAIRTARHVYSAIGREVARNGYDAGAGRAFVRKFDKTGLVAQAVLETLSEVPTRLLRRLLRGHSPQIPRVVIEYANAVRIAKPVTMVAPR